MSPETLEPPRVLLLHGLLSGRTVWGPLRREVEGELRVVAPDLLGFGRAARPQGVYSLEAIVEHLQPLIEWYRPTHVVGHSMGGIVALAIRQRYGEMLKGVGLIGLPVFGSRAEALEFLELRGRIVGGFVRNNRVAHAGCVVAKRTGPLWLPYVRKRLPRHPDDVFASVFHHCGAAHHGAFDSIVFGGRVASLSEGGETPVAMLHGGRDRAAPLDEAAQLAAARGWSLTVLEQANHQVIVEDPGAVGGWIRETVIRTGEAVAEGQGHGDSRSGQPTAE